MGKDLPQPRLEPVINKHTARGQEEDARRAGYTSRQWSFKDKLLEGGKEEGECQTTEHANGASGTANLAATSDGHGKSAPHQKAQKEGDIEGYEGHPGNQTCSLRKWQEQEGWTSQRT